MPDEKQQKVSGLPLDLYEQLDRDPQTIAPWYVKNWLTRSLAHLLGFDGTQARFLRCNTSGTLRVDLYSVIGSTLTALAAGSIPVKLRALGDFGLTFGYAGSNALPAVLDALHLITATASAQAALGATGLTTADLGGTPSGLVVVYADTGPVRVHSSATAGARTEPVGIIAAGGSLAWLNSRRYVDMDNVGAAGYYHVRTFGVSAVNLS